MTRETLIRLRGQSDVRRLMEGRLPRDYARIAAVSSSPCANRGHELTGAERNAVNLDHRRRWFLCLHPDQPLGPHVCGCQGCGPKCAGYVSSHGL